MKRTTVISLLAVLLVVTACKSNPEAYSSTFQRLKEKEETKVNENAQMNTGLKTDSLTLDSVAPFKAETWTLLLGQKVFLSKFNVVVATFVNRTNAKSFYSRMLAQNRPAVLIQNQDKLYRIAVASAQTLDQAEIKKQELKADFSSVSIVKLLNNQ
jgi:hypothetical protein